MAEVERKGLDERVDETLGKLGIDDSEVQKHATELAKKATFDMAINRQPDSIVGGAVYLSCLLKNHSVTQERVSNAAGITPVTLRRVYQKIAHEEYDMGIDPDATESLVSGEAGMKGFTTHLLKEAGGDKETLCGNSRRVKIRNVQEINQRSLCGNCLSIKRGKYE